MQAMGERAEENVQSEGRQRAISRFWHAIIFRLRRRGAAAGASVRRRPLDSPTNQQDPKMTTNRMASLSAAIMLAMAALVLGQVPPSAFTFQEFLLLSASWQLA
jgi:hypothetical protein